VKPTFKHLFWNLNEADIDLLNVLINIIERNDDFEEDDFDYKQIGYIIDTNMHELASCLGFLELKVDNIIQRIEALQKSIATIYYEDDTNIYMTKASFIYQYNVSSTNNDINKRLNIVVNTKIVKILREKKSLFELFYKFDRYGIKSKYSKIIYERFYDRDKTVEVLDIDTLSKEIDFGLKYKSLDWSRLNSNILKRVVKEITEKTDLYFEYEKVKTVHGDSKRKQTTKVKISTSVAPETDTPKGYFTNEFLMKRKIAYYIERDIKARFAASKKFKVKDIIKNPKAYMYKLRKIAEQNYDEYEARVLIQEWLNNIKYKNSDYEGLVVLENYSKDNQFVTVNNKYKLYDIKKKIEISSSARDSRIKINAFMQRGSYNIIETEQYIKECSISYTQG